MIFMAFVNKDEGNKELIFYPLLFWVDISQSEVIFLDQIQLPAHIIKQPLSLGIFLQREIVEKY